MSSAFFEMASDNLNVPFAIFDNGLPEVFPLTPLFLCEKCLKHGAT